MRLALYPLVQQFQYRNGTNLVAGRIYVYYRGRTRLATIYKDQNGTIAQNPLTCDADGRAPCFVDTNYQYTIVVCDARGKELFSQDLDADNAININDALSGDSKLYIINSDGTISVNATSGDTWIQYDLGTFNKPLGVQAPLYWAQDDEECSIIGASGLATTEELSSVSSIVDEKLDTTAFSEVSGSFITAHQSLDGLMSAELLGYNNKGRISGYNGSAFAGQGGSELSAGDYIDITDDIISVTGLQPSGDYVVHDEMTAYATQDDLSSVSSELDQKIDTKLDESAFAEVSGDFYTNDNPSGFINSLPEDLVYSSDIEDVVRTGDIQDVVRTGDITDVVRSAELETTLEDYQPISGMTAYQPVGDYQTAGNYYSASNPSGFLVPDDITGKQDITGMTAYQLSGDYATNTQLSEVSSTITAMIPTGEFELCAGSGIELVDDPIEKTTTINVTAQGGNPEVEAEVISHSADWNTVTNKADATALNDYQTIAGMTAYQPVGDYLTTSDSAEFMTTSERSDYIPTGVSSEFYTTANESGFITDIPDTYLQNTDLSTEDGKITAISGIPLSAGDPSEYELSAGEGISIVNDPINSATIISVSGDYVDQTELSTVSADITAMIPTALTGDYLDKASADTLYYGINNPSGFITGVDLTPYQTVNGMTAYQTIEGMTAYQEKGDYLSSNALDNLSGNWETVTSKLDTTAFSDVSGTFLTAHQDLSNYLTTSDSAEFYTTANESGYITSVPDTYLQNTDLEISDNKITGISGVPLAAGSEETIDLSAGDGISIIETADKVVISCTGGDVPEGVMAESGLEYNAVNEISGYNGSAIAQYGAEKQWLVHDDTLVHAANSAQYALGVNLSAVAQLLGVDETVLFDNNGVPYTGAFTTTEPLSAFNEVAFYVDSDTNAEGPVKVVIPMLNRNNNKLQFGWVGAFDGWYNISWTYFYNTTGMTAFQPVSGSFFGSNAAHATERGTWASGSMQLFKIVGIGRKQ